MPGADPTAIGVPLARPLCDGKFAFARHSHARPIRRDIPYVTCTVCRSPNRAKLERELAQGVEQKRVATKYKVGHASVRRHVANCLVPAVRSATPPLDALRAKASIDAGMRVLEIMRAALERTVQIADEAFRGSNPDLELKALQVVGRHCRTIAALTGEIKPPEAPIENHLHLTWPQFEKIYRERALPSLAANTPERG